MFSLKDKKLADEIVSDIKKADVKPDILPEETIKKIAEDFIDRDTISP